MWELEGYDTFSEEYYPLDGEYPDEASAEKAAQARLEELEKSQPSTQSGGQGGIQDRVYVVKPNGARYRVFPKSRRAG